MRHYEILRMVEAENSDDEKDSQEQDTRPRMSRIGTIKAKGVQFGKEALDAGAKKFKSELKQKLRNAASSSWKKLSPLESEENTANNIEETTAGCISASAVPFFTDHPEDVEEKSIYSRKKKRKDNE